MALKHLGPFRGLCLGHGLHGLLYHLPCRRGLPDHRHVLLGSLPVGSVVDL